MFVIVLLYSGICLTPPVCQDLKNSLERELENVKHQQRRAMLRDEAALSFRGPIESISDLAGFIDPRFVEAWGPGGTLRPSVLRGLIEEVCDGVYTFPLLDPEFCERLIQHGDAFTRFANEKGVSQLVGAERPLVLDTMKLGSVPHVPYMHHGIHTHTGQPTNTGMKFPHANHTTRGN
jgi:hypothetical protein